MTNKEKGITTQRRIYYFVKEYMMEHGYAPSYREIANGVGLRSSSTINNQIQNMLENGALETDLDHSSPRAIRVGKDIWDE